MLVAFDDHQSLPKGSYLPKQKSTRSYHQPRFYKLLDVRLQLNIFILCVVSRFHSKYRKVLELFARLQLFPFQGWHELLEQFSEGKLGLQYSYLFLSLIPARF